MENIFLERFLYLLNEKFDGNKSKLSKVTGITASTLSQYSPPRSSAPSAKQIVLLSKAFNCSPAYLLGLEDEIGQLNIGDTSLTISTEEKDLIRYFRSMTVAEKRAVFETAKAFYNNHVQNGEVVKI